MKYSIANPMNDVPVPRSIEDVSSEDIAAVELALHAIERSHHREQLVADIAQWELVLKMFKEFVERPYSQTRDKAKFESRHRALLTAILALGELLLVRAESFPEGDFRGSGYSKAFVLANVRYLRDKHRQRYGLIDPKEAEATFAKIQDARSAIVQGGPCASAAA